MTVQVAADEGTAANVIKQINAKNAKIVACLVVIGFCFYHGILHVRYGKCSGCGAALLIT